MGSNVRQEAIKTIASTKHKLEPHRLQDDVHIKDLFGSTSSAKK